MPNISLAAEIHDREFGGDPRFCLAPGRVNLIGEHTDYAGGFVMPAAIDFGTIASVSPRTDRKIEIFSDTFAERVTFAVDAVPESGRHHWSDYPLGVLWALREAGAGIPPFSLTLSGDVPLAAGLSSSASIEVATAFALLGLTETDLPRSQIALLCQRAENVYVGASCGIMDQFIACRAAENHALLLDCRSLAFRLAPIPHHVSLVIANTMVKHSIAGGEYATRRAEVEKGTAILRSHRPEIALLREATLEDLRQWGHEMPENVLRRCRHVITENQRTVAAAEALESSDLKHLGGLMAAAHASYRDDFEASCPEADVMVEVAQRLPGLIGARLTGGGFGGCTVNLVEPSLAAAFTERLHEEYQAATGIDAAIYQCHAAPGARAVERR
jgi:galactokinase